MERHWAARRSLPGGPLAAAARALAHDAALGARIAGTLAGAVAAGAVAAPALALLLGRFATWPAWLLLGACGGLVAGAGLAAWAIADRRHARRARRARLRAACVVAVFAVVVLAAGLTSSRWTGLAAATLGVTLAIMVAGAGALGLWSGSWAVERMVAGRRRAWHARLRAARLTRRMLGMAAYRQLQRDGALPVRSTLYPDRVYLVPLRTTPAGARILVLEGGRPIGGLCLRPREMLPDPEEALAHILAIRADERAWLARANFFPQDRSLTPQALGLLPGRPGNYDR